MVEKLKAILTKKAAKAMQAESKSNLSAEELKLLAEAKKKKKKTS